MVVEKIKGITTEGNSFVFIVGIVAGLIIGIAIHELAHLFVAKLFGRRILQVEIGSAVFLLKWKVRHTEWKIGLVPLGGIVKWQPTPRHRFSDTKLIVAAGPASNAVLAVISYIYLKEFLHGNEVRAVLVGFCATQCYLVVFNLLPIQIKRKEKNLALDGYKLLASANDPIAGDTSAQLRYFLQEYVDDMLPHNWHESVSEMEWTVYYDALGRHNDMSIPELVTAADELKGLSSGHSVLEASLLDLVATRHVLSDDAVDAVQFSKTSKTLLDRIESLTSLTLAMQHTRFALMVDAGLHAKALATTDYSETIAPNNLANCLNNAYRARCEYKCGSKELALQKAHQAELLSNDQSGGFQVVHVLKRMRREMDFSNSV